MAHERRAGIPRGGLRGRASKFRARAGRTKLFTAVATAVIGGAAIALAAWFFLGLVLPVSGRPVPRVEVVRISLLVAAGVGGAVALVVAYRRQRDIEQGRFIERFGSAAHQLAEEDPAIRLAGAYAMAGVANEMSGLERQQCIDVLCGYLRLPYLPERGANHQHALIRRHPAGADRTEDERHFRFRQNDKEVRQTIVRIIARHLQPGAGTSWSDLDYDFTGAHLESADFSEVVFRGANVSFRGATFSGELASFEQATFSGGLTTFERATFGGERTMFDAATFSGANTWFSGATFSGGLTTFDRATFNGGDTWFDEATFSGGNASFNGATFSGGLVTFDGATFSGKRTSFDRATFSGEDIWFSGAKFRGVVTSFEGATFSGELTTFDEATFSGKDASFGGATFSGAHTWFSGAKFSGADTSFEGTTYSGKYASFEKATFSGLRISFQNAIFGDPAPRFDWDSDVSLKPPNVKPDEWPPRPTG